MKNISWNKILPHILAVVIFLVIAVIYCKPALEGKVLQQHDLAQWVGMSKDQQNYMDKNGHAPLWTNSMFSGMPGYMIIGYSNNYISGYFIALLSLWLPQPVCFFFMACICFYFLSQVLKIRPWIGIIGALMYAYATYNPIIISVGHITKMYSIAMMPGLLGAIYLVLRKKYWLGGALTGLFTAGLVAENHYQIVYYTLLIIAFLVVAFIIKAIREKDFKHLGLSLGILALSAAAGGATNAVMLLPNLEYAKETIRGGSQIGAAGADGSASATSGLNEDYAFSYSMSMSEPFVMMVPRMFGGASGKQELPQESSKAIEALQSMPQQLAQQLAGNLSYYWGGIQPGTSGPPYVGAIVCFLAILGFVIVDKKYRWWMLACSAIAIIMSWGGYFKDVNKFFLEYLPMYNKFRAPSMIIVIPTLLFGVMAALALEKITASIEEKKNLLQEYKKALMITGGIFVVLFLLYFSFDYVSDIDKEILKQVNQIQQDDIKTAVKSFFTGMEDDRRTLFFNDILRSLFFVAVAAATLWFYLKNKLKAPVVLAIIGVFSLIDLMVIDVKYLGPSDYEAKEDYETTFNPTAADNQIMQDKTNFRVMDLRSGLQGAFNSGALTAYFHNSIGGYHPAKLSIYQDLIDSQLYKFPNCLPVLDMLNTKYVITQNDQVQINPMAAGNAWFVPEVKFEKTSQAVMKDLDTFHPKKTAVTEDAFKDILKQPASFDSAATITLVSNHNDTVDYKSKSAVEMPAVFSEVYYKEGWKAFVDGKETPIAKVDYVLRSIMVPAGEHNIQFIFRPETHVLGWSITNIATILIVLALLVAVFMSVRKQKKTV